MIKGHRRCSHSPKSHWWLQDSDFGGLVNFSSPKLILTVKIAYPVFFPVTNVLPSLITSAQAIQVPVYTGGNFRRVCWPGSISGRVCFVVLISLCSIRHSSGRWGLEHFYMEAFYGTMWVHKSFCSPCTRYLTTEANMTLPFDCNQTGVTPNGMALGVAACSTLSWRLPSSGHYGFTHKGKYKFCSDMPRSNY